MISVVSCLTLVVYMESRGLPESAQQLVAQTVINRAKKTKVSVCDEVKGFNNYSFYHDKKPELVDDIAALEKAVHIAKKVVKLNDSVGYVPTNYTYFNECFLGKRYKTKVPMNKIKNMCFY